MSGRVDLQDSEIQPWDSDHTALVHVLWEARRLGYDLASKEGPDQVASLIMRSEWMTATRRHAKEGRFG